MQMKAFWSAKPSQAERTHEWDVRLTDWDQYPKGTALISPSFSCGGVDSITVSFWPNGRLGNSGKNGTVRIYSARNLEVVVGLKIQFKSDFFPTEVILYSPRDLGQGEGSGGSFPHFEGLVCLVDTICVEVLWVKHKYQPEEVQQVPCVRGGVLRVVNDRARARESFFVVGSTKRFSSGMRSYLAELGEVVAVERLHVQLKHHDGALVWWGHGALLPCLTADEVDAMKVRRSNHPVCMPDPIHDRQ